MRWCGSKKPKVLLAKQANIENIQIASDWPLLTATDRYWPLLQETLGLVCVFCVSLCLPCQSFSWSRSSFLCCSLSFIWCWFVFIFVCGYACLVSHSADGGVFSFLCVVTLVLSVIQLMVVCFPVCVWLRLPCQSFNWWLCVFPYYNYL